MPQVTIEGRGTYNVAEGRRLVKAIEACGVDIGHRCGGNARCTTCRVHFIAGEPETMTRAEAARLKERGLLGQARLSCQIAVDRPMTVAVLVHVSEMGWTDPGPEPADEVMPEAAWFPKEELLREG
jgi:ferredoxin